MILGEGAKDRRPLHLPKTPPNPQPQSFKEMSKPKIAMTCVYCGVDTATEREDVLAKQFFPPEQRYRGDLVKVPACGNCNRTKQKMEDSAGIFFQFSDATPALEAVLEKRALRTFKKNERLKRAFQQGCHWLWVQLESGVLVKRLAIQLTQEESYHINEWFKFLTKGLFYYEFKEILPKDHLIYLLKPIDYHQFRFYLDFILNSHNHRSRSLANGEFRYIMASNDKDGLSIWMFFFRSVEMVAVTASPELPANFHAVLSRNSWKESHPKRRSI